MGRVKGNTKELSSLFLNKTVIVFQSAKEAVLTLQGLKRTKTRSVDAKFSSTFYVKKKSLVTQTVEITQNYDCKILNNGIWLVYCLPRIN